MRLSHLLCVVLGAVATVAATPLFGGNAAPPRARGDAVLESRVAALDARIDELEAHASGVADGVGESASLHDLGVLRSRLDEIEGQIGTARLGRAMEDVGAYPPNPDAERIRAVMLTTVPAKHEEAVAAWTAVAESTPDPERKADAYFEVGQLQLKLRNTRAAADAYGRVVELIGLGSARGQTAAQHQGLCEFWSKDHVAAYGVFRRLADAPSLMHSTAPTIRHWAAVLAARTGDVEYARRELRRYIEDYDREGYEVFREYVEGARKLLGELQ